MHKLKKHISKVLVALISLALSGCYTMSTVEIEVIKPAKISIPSTINSILVVNNSLSFHVDSFKHDIQKGLFMLDTTTTQMLAYQVNDILNQSPRFDTSILINEIYFRQAKDLLQPIKWESVNQLCEKYQCDALVSLEAFGIDDNMIKMSYYDGYGYVSYRSLVLIVNSMWRIYNYNEQMVFEHHIQRDTIYINGIETKADYLKAVSQTKFITYLSNKIASSISTKVADRLAPYWQPVYRHFYNNGNELLQKAAKLAYTDDWRGAALIWNPLTDHEDKRLAASACYNMALACEVEGKLDLAEIWLEESLKLYKTYVANNYLIEILKRKREADRLNKQFGIEK